MIIRRNRGQLCKLLSDLNFRTKSDSDNVNRNDVGVLSYSNAPCNVKSQPLTNMSSEIML